MAGHAARIRESMGQPESSYGDGLLLVVNRLP
jgi:hypothetical protein